MVVHLEGHFCMGWLAMNMNAKFPICNQHIQHTYQAVPLEMYVWWVLAQPSVKAEWRCATTTHGGQCVIMGGEQTMLWLFASSSDTTVRIAHIKFWCSKALIPISSRTPYTLQWGLFWPRHWHYTVLWSQLQWHWVIPFLMPLFIQHWPHYMHTFTGRRSQLPSTRCAILSELLVFITNTENILTAINVLYAFGCCIFIDYINKLLSMKL